MKFRNAHLALIPFVLAFAVGCGGSNVSGIDKETRGGGFGDSGTNIIALPPLAATPSTADGGTNVSWTLSISTPAIGNEVFTLSASPAGSFTGLPSTVTIPSGQTSVTFSSTLAKTADGDVTVTATSSAHVRVGHVTARAMWGE